MTDNSHVPFPTNQKWNHDSLHFFFTTSSLDFPALKWRPPEFASVLIDFFSVPLFFAISQSFIFVFGSEAPIGWHENRF